ncbi:hypothetical protein [Streptomyces sp. NPDC048606]|uniref:hypothetical protein n=1 Tax=Streptomyces sp. NPDC048606 TaxID=3154726 RepID=UPI0034220C39
MSARPPRPRAWVDALSLFRGDLRCSGAGKYEAFGGSLFGGPDAEDHYVAPVVAPLAPADATDGEA